MRRKILLLQPTVGEWDEMRTAPALPLALIHAATLVAEEYDVEIFDASTIEELAGDLNALLAEIVRAPERRIEELAAANHSRRRGQGEG